MKVYDLDHNQYSISLGGNVVAHNDNRAKSNYHLRARKLLRAEFPTCQVLEEVNINLHKNMKAFIDFFVMPKQIVVEVHGEQHYKYSSLFHKSRIDFIKQKQRDTKLIEWCAVNNFQYIELKFNEDDQEWLSKIRAR